IYDGVFKLPPAHILVFKNNKAEIRNYWSLDYLPKLRISENDAAGEVLRLLEEAVRIRLYSDVPIGAFLSGGIDSSIVVALMSRLSDKRIKTFCIGFEESDYNELKFARNVADRYNTEHNEFIVKPNAMEVLPLLVERYGEPYADSSSIPTYYVSRETKKYVTVALNGDGGDENFAGYERYQAMIAAESFRKLPYMFKAAITGLLSHLPDSINSKNRVRNIKRFFLAANLPEKDRYIRWLGVFDDNSKVCMYSDEFRSKLSGRDPVRLMDPYLGNLTGPGLPDKLLITDTNIYLPDDLLVKVDIASMANSLEARSPFLDHKLMEFVAKLPGEYKIKGFIKKYILKRAIKDLVPHENINRRKMGFGVPIGSWFRNDLKSFLRDTLLSERSLGRGYFKQDAVRNIIDMHIGKKEDHAYRLWALLMLELWHRRFIDQ
ncbi:MAG TPA: asparagine synthase-related protein, partial [Candidatus Omnitrophota bacterium]|nr:asparagine synthase-related protein [Candidatus Omnitrophota bacterium]